MGRGSETILAGGITQRSSRSVFVQYQGNVLALLSIVTHTAVGILAFQLTAHVALCCTYVYELPVMQVAARRNGVVQ